jgi:ribosomal protein S18 acetylase RimI-like enzyme
MELFERLWQHIPRPLRLPIRATIASIQQNPLFRYWIHQQIKHNNFKLHTYCQTQTQNILEYSMFTHFPRLCFRVLLSWQAWTIAKGDLLLFQRPISPEAWLFSLWVHPLLRRVYLGTTIVQQLLHIAKSNSCHTIALSVESDNCHAIKLYAKLGFYPFSPQYAPQIINPAHSYLRVDI